MRILRIAVAVALAAGTVAGGLTLSAAPASADVPASIPIQYVTGFFWGDTLAVPVEGTVSCPSGSRVVSSGAQAGGRLGILVGIAPNIDTFTDATATSYSQGFMVLTVGCMPTAALSEVTSRTIELPAGSGFRRGVVSCPAGMRAFGGGGYMVGPFGRPSRDSSLMTSNTITADGTGWTYAATSGETTTRPVITTQCAPLRGSYVASNSTPLPADITSTNVTAPCRAGDTTLSGGVYLSRSDGNEVRSGAAESSLITDPTRQWAVRARAFGASGEAHSKLVALAQCIR